MYKAIAWAKYSRVFSLDSGFFILVSGFCSTIEVPYAIVAMLNAKSLDFCLFKEEVQNQKIRKNKQKI